MATSSAPTRAWCRTARRVMAGRRPAAAAQAEARRRRDAAAATTHPSPMPSRLSDYRAACLREQQPRAAAAADSRGGSMQKRRVIAGLVLLACASLTAQQPRSSWSGVYTAAQASAGEKIYFEKCASCHGPDLGGIERAPALAGGAFLNGWHGQDLRRLLERIDAMPPNAPGSLPAADSVALLAFLLRAAEMPSGTTALPTDRGQLSRITFERTRAAAGASAPAAAPAPPAAPAAQGPQGPARAPAG